MSKVSAFRKHSAPSPKERSMRQKWAVVLTSILVVSLIVGGTFAWTDLRQHYINHFRGGVNADVLLHDDFEPGINKDVYVENPGDQPLVVRVKFKEYFQIGSQPLVGLNSKDTRTWEAHRFPAGARVGQTPPVAGYFDGGCGLLSHTCFDWLISGAQKNYLQGTSEQGNAAYSNAQVGTIGPNGQPIAQTLPASPPITMAEYLANRAAYLAEPFGRWVLDVDGWAYWSKLLPPGEATNLLLDDVVAKTVKPDDIYLYQIDVILNAANKTEAHKLQESNDITSDGQDIIDDIINAMKVSLTGPAYLTMGGDFGTYTGQFTANVTAPSGSNAVVWSLVNPPSGVSIDQTGKVAVGTDESLLGKTVTLRATSVQDGTVRGTATAEIVLPITQHFFPDPTFRAYVAGLPEATAAPAGVFTKAQADAVTWIDVSGTTVTPNNVTDLTGLKWFEKVTYLFADYNQLTSLDVSKNTALDMLGVTGNQLTSLDLSKNTALALLGADNNRLTVLDLSKNTALKYLQVHGNQLSVLDMSKNTELVTLGANNNQLVAVDVSKSVWLIYLEVNNNRLDTLDLSKNTSLILLHAHNNQLSALDVSNHTSLEALLVSNNRLTSLDIRKTALTADITATGQPPHSTGAGLNAQNNGPQFTRLYVGDNRPGITDAYQQTGNPGLVIDRTP